MADLDSVTQEGALICIVVRHDAWCPGAIGSAEHCICNPVPEVVTPTQMAKSMSETRNRAQRRADAKQKGRKR